MRDTTRGARLVKDRYESYARRDRSRPETLREPFRDRTGPDALVLQLLGEDLGEA